MGTTVLLFLLAFLARGDATFPRASNFFSTAAEESFSTYQMNGDGDLWPSCWADDGNLYTANGDGSGFSGSGLRFDLAVSRITGTPPTLYGTTLATNVGTNWSGHDHNRKPTGMLCVDGAIYLAFQNLNLKSFSDVPAASIARSDDHGRTWRWDESAPMFGTPDDPKSSRAFKFTTIVFLDYGRDSINAPQNYVYAYGLDNSWREQSALYLARIPKGTIQSRSSWQFFAGESEDGQPKWTDDIGSKIPVLVDERRLYPELLDKGGCGANQAVVSQGGVVYDAPLKRYIFASWSCATHQLYEAPEPWGPWSLFLSKDFGRQSSPANRGQYGTNIPSKFISKDGKTLWLQSNVCCGGNSYTYALRKIYVETQTSTKPMNAQSEESLALAEGGVRAISKSTSHGALCGTECFDIISSGDANASEDDDDGENKSQDFWGYTWPKNYNLNKLVYEAGKILTSGGWFNANLRVQVRREGRWTEVKGLVVTPPYIFDGSLPSHRLTTLRFNATWGDGIRVIGTPGGSGHFTSIAQLGAYFTAGNLVDDSGFEYQISPNISGVWRGEGSGPKGIARFEQRGRSGANNAWLENAADEWNGIVQTVAVKPRTEYRLSAWVRSNVAATSGRLGVRAQSRSVPLAQTSFGAAARYVQVTADFNSREESSVDIYVGFSGERTTRSLEVDDVALEPR